MKPISFKRITKQSVDIGGDPWISQTYGQENSDTFRILEKMWSSSVVFPKTNLHRMNLILIRMVHCQFERILLLSVNGHELKF